jgi:hypothetical protein
VPTAIETYLGSKELKKLIVSRSFDLKLPLQAICLDLGISYREFMQSYINSNENKHYEIDEEKFEGILSHLGIEIRHQFIINKNFDYFEQQNKLREVLKKHKNGE